MRERVRAEEIARTCNAPGDETRTDKNRLSGRWSAQKLQSCAPPCLHGEGVGGAVPVCDHRRCELHLQEPQPAFHKPGRRAEAFAGTSKPSPQRWGKRFTVRKASVDLRCPLFKEATRPKITGAYQRGQITDICACLLAQTAHEAEKSFLRACRTPNS